MAAGKTYEPISTTTLSSAQSSVSFTSISGSFTDLVIVTNHGNATDGSGFYIRFNSDSGGNYSVTTLAGTGGSPTTYKTTNDSQIPMNWQYNGYGTSINNGAVINIFNYPNTAIYKTISYRMRSLDNGGTTVTMAGMGLWRSTAAITTITLTGNSNFIAGSMFTLYGIAKA